MTTASARILSRTTVECSAPLTHRMSAGDLAALYVDELTIVAQINGVTVHRDDAASTPTLAADAAVVAVLRGGELIDDRALDAVIGKECELGTVKTADIEALFARHAHKTSLLRVGTVRAGSGDAPARVRADGFRRHTFVCGQSGSGKTYALGLLLERLAACTDVGMIVLDANSDHVHLASRRADAELAAGLRQQIGDAEAAEFEAQHERASEQIQVFGTAAEDGPALRIRFSELTTEEQMLVLGIDAIAEPEAAHALSRIVATLPERYGIDEVLAEATARLDDAAVALARRIELSGVRDWQIWARNSELTPFEQIDEYQRDGHNGHPLWRVGVLDVGTIDPAERDIAHLAMLRRLWERRAMRRPIIVVADEAHNLAPARPATPIQQAITSLVIRIAAEGRKYGLYLIVATQRPGKLHAEVLSQCDNLVLMRMNGQRDVDDLAQVFTFVPESILRTAPSFGLGDALIAGPLTSGMALPVKFGARLTPEGGADVAADWALPHLEGVR